ncbi:MAG: 2-C-methyl-D-erythritol 4-phosphate cytidylyltransferase [archaeon]|nr:2-C-methyl-D-erythritol 4-phosphate cytidylyltransferase [archaeon]
MKQNELRNQPLRRLGPRGQARSTGGKMNYAIVGAGGRGKRMEAGINKALLKIGGKEVILHTLKKFQNCSAIQAIVLIISEEDKQIFEQILEINNISFPKLKLFAEPGEERQHSMQNGLQKLKELNPKHHDIVLFHNACNPFIQEKEIIECLRAAEQFDASVAAFPVKDTIRKVNEKLFSTETLNRKELWSMQTPQAMKYELACKAFEQAARDNFLGTDDVQLCERIGIFPKIVQCSYDNIKITTPEDLAISEMILKRQEGK